MMPGMIMLWYGSEETIPSGWAPCDGTLGTPDLRARFVRCAGAGVSPGETGGSTNHVHNFLGDGHAHDIADGSYIDNVYPAGDYGHSVDSSPASGTTDSAYHSPVYYGLWYIMKLPIP